MKVLVTGGCGFIGSHTCEYYANKGAEVIAYDNMTKYELERTGYAVDTARTYNLDFLKGINVEVLEKDIRDYDSLLQATRGCDYLIHTAAQPAMTISWEDPRLDFSSNVLGTFNVLEVARHLEIPVVSCGTIHIYGNKINETLREEKTRYIREPAGIDENHPTAEGFLSPLHASKTAGDLYIQAYIDTYKLQAASYRLTGMYGPRQFGGEDHGWVANFAIRAVTGRPLTIFGSGKQLRDILYARDAAKAFDAFYNNREPGIYNIGGDEKTAISLIECIDLIAEIIGRKLDVRFADDRFGDLQYFICDTVKAKKNLKWEAEVEPREGVTKLIEWIMKNDHIFR